MMNGMMKMNGDLDDMGMNMSLQQMDMNVVMYPEITGNAAKKNAHAVDHRGRGMITGMHDHVQQQCAVRYRDAELRHAARHRNPPRCRRAVKELRFELTGNMDRYLWASTTRPSPRPTSILIRKGENVRHHPAQQQHDAPPHAPARPLLPCVNGQGDHAPLKNVLDIMPMETDTIEFAATEEGDWFFHCHILYHMMSGMGRVFTYADGPQPRTARCEEGWRIFLKEDKALALHGAERLRHQRPRRRVDVHEQALEPAG
jgi:FtsP/CotA-like multicopper oxidase with cupredoxin domain